jgi:hypothetical protein
MIVPPHYNCSARFRNSKQSKRIVILESIQLRDVAVGKIIETLNDKGANLDLAG